MPDSDYEAEGFKWLAEHPEALPKNIGGVPRNWFVQSDLSWEAFARKRLFDNESMCVIRFELLALTPAGEEMKNLIEQRNMAHT